MTKKLTAALLTVMGFLFITAYIRSATTDVVYTDYMRIINTYLPDVTDPSPYLRGDVLERIPVTFLERLFNVKVLGYSTTFDMLLGALGLAVCAAVIGHYCVRQNVRLFVIPVLMFIIFSLDKWEMLTNGTGWMHFWAIALFYIHFIVYDGVRGGSDGSGRGDRCIKGGGSGKDGGCGREAAGAAFDTSVDIKGSGDAGKISNVPPECAGDGDWRDTAGLIRSKRKERVLFILPSLIILLIAGPYCAAYSGCVCLVYFIDCVGELRGIHRRLCGIRSRSRAVPAKQVTIRSNVMYHADTDGNRGEDRTDRAAVYGGDVPDSEAGNTAKKDIRCVILKWLPRFISVLIPFGLYFLSHMSLEYEYSGATSMSLAQLMISDPGFLPQLLIRSFAGLVLTSETAQAAGLPDMVVICEGLVIFTAYVVSIVLNFKTKLYKKTAVPMMLMIMALLSHGLIVASRWIFLDNSYSMSSRYALQYMGGSIGILLTMFAACENKHQRVMCKKNTSQDTQVNHDTEGTEVIKEAAQGKRDGAAPGAGRHLDALPAYTLGVSLLILSGQLMNCAREIHMAPYRQEAFENMRETAINYEQRTDAELKRVFQYSDPAKTRRALGILRDNGWNVFRQTDPADD